MQQSHIPDGKPAASFVLLHLQSQLFLRVFLLTPGRTAGLRRWDDTHRLRPVPFHFPNLFCIPHCGKRKTPTCMRNVLLCGSTGMKKYRELPRWPFAR